MGKNNAPFTPPLPRVDPPRQVTLESARNLTKKERKRLKKTVDANLHSRLGQGKQQKRKLQKEWWKNNWISLLSLIFAIIAALPVIIQTIDSILKLLGLWS